MKYFFIAIVFLSIDTWASSSIWNTLLQFDNDGCFENGNPARMSSVLSERNWKEFQGTGYFPYTRIDSKKVRLPSCKSMLFKGNKAGELYAISNTAVYRSLPKAGSPHSWKKIVDFKNRLLDLLDPRMVFDVNNQLVAWVGHKPIQSGYSKNKLVVFDLKNKKRTEQIKVGTGYEGLSAVALIPGKTDFLVASVDWCAQVKAYDVSGAVTRDFPGINSQLKDQGECLGWNNIWRWNIDLGYEPATNQYLLHFSRSDEQIPGPVSGKIFHLDLDKDEIVDVFEP